MGGLLNWIMLNPSTATDRDDETIRDIRTINDPLSTDEQVQMARERIEGPKAPIRDDPTIRKCCGFARRWGYSSIVVTNLFAFRATDPKGLHSLIRDGKLDIAIGDGNDKAIANAANEADLVVVAWGANAARYQNRVAAVMKMFLRPSCIGVTKDGHPLHPCMAAYTDEPKLWTAPATDHTWPPEPDKPYVPGSLADEAL